MTRTLLFLLVLALLPLSVGQAGGLRPDPIDASDFTVDLPGGAFNLITDDRAGLERITGREMEFYDEFPELGIAYHRLLTDAFNFFTGTDDGLIEQVDFARSGRTARGIGFDSTRAEVFAAYGEPQGWFDEHGYIRCEYETVIGNAYCELFILINASKDKVIDIRLIAKRDQRPAL